MKVKCAHCGTVTEKPNGAVNRANKIGAPIYCDRRCAGMGRRKPQRTVEEMKALKAAYDRDYRARNIDRIKAEKKAYYAANHDREKERAYRQKTMQRHVEYCRRPEYREYKRQYDRMYRAKKEYGDLAECFLLVMDIRAECLSQQTDYEIRFSKGTLNKRQQRKRNYERTLREEPEVGPLGNLELRQGGQNGSLAGR